MPSGYSETATFVPSTVSATRGRSIEPRAVPESTSTSAVTGPYRTLRSVIVGCRPPHDGAAFERAVALAADSDAAAVVVGLSDEWETEGFDRDVSEGLVAFQLSIKPE